MSVSMGPGSGRVIRSVSGHEYCAAEIYSGWGTGLVRGGATAGVLSGVSCTGHVSGDGGRTDVAETARMNVVGHHLVWGEACRTHRSRRAKQTEHLERSVEGSGRWDELGVVGS
jgi:hypothetical protein